ncbi:BQ5605_C126g13337 [Microbotryum silenes-dioicae]|uniref:BQ5605_C018g08572 protein n=1 Tax=Microbotryum silenes-dioicae TaxID=796604 RepID=A0A2X0MI77_9BASI|nr:BQ5605_C018g08572 [Microbotryum silenes-dioicae]SGY27635.1 BQ5605_C126g13337 [Microbotryum silenes-dioicae]
MSPQKRIVAFSFKMFLTRLLPSSQLLPKTDISFAPRSSSPLDTSNSCRSLHWTTFRTNRSSSIFYIALSTLLAHGRHLYKTTHRPFLQSVRTRPPEVRTWLSKVRAHPAPLRLRL